GVAEIETTLKPTKKFQRAPAWSAMPPSGGEGGVGEVVERPRYDRATCGCRHGEQDDTASAHALLSATCLAGSTPAVSKRSFARARSTRCSPSSPITTVGSWASG